MEEIASEVNTRNVSGDVIDQFSVGVNVSSTSGERKSLVVDRGDQPCAQQDAGTGCAVEEVVQSERGQNLEEEETKGVTDAAFEWRGFLSSAVCEVGVLGEPNNSLRGVRIGGARRRGNENTFTRRGLVIRDTSEIRRKMPALQKNQKTLSLTANAKLAFFLPVFSLHSFSRSCR